MPPVSRKDAILALLKEAGPMGATDIAKRVRMPRGNVYNALIALRESGLLNHDVANATWSAHNGGQPPKAAASAAPPTNGELPRWIQPGKTTARVLAQLRNGPATVNEIAAKLKVSRAAVQSSMRALDRNGLIAPRASHAAYALASGDPAPERMSPPAPIARRAARAAVTPATPAGQVATSTYTYRQLESIVLRMQNANDHAALFTPVDFDLIHKLQEVFTK